MRAPRTFPWIPLLVVCGLAAFCVTHLMPVLIPFALSFAAAYVLNPLVNSAQVRGFRRQTVVILGFLAVGVGAALLAGTLAQALGRELSSFQEEAPTYIARAKVGMLDLQHRAADRLPFLAKQIRDLDARSLAPLLERAQSLPGYLLSAAPLLSLLFLVPFISFFLLMDGPAAIDGLIQKCPSRYVEQALHLLSEIDSSLGAYLRGLIVIAVAIAAASYAGLKFLGVDQALWVSALAGVSSFVPYLGAVVGMIVGGLVAVFQFGEAAAGLKVVLLFLLIRLADEAVLQPYVAKHSVKLHPLVFLGSFMVGGELFGFIGLLFAVPVACVIKALVEVGWSWYSSQARLGASDAPGDAAIPYT